MLVPLDLQRGFFHCIQGAPTIERLDFHRPVNGQCNIISIGWLYSVCNQSQPDDHSSQCRPMKISKNHPMEHWDL